MSARNAKYGLCTPLCLGLLAGGLFGAGCASWPVAPEKVVREARIAADCLAPHARALGVPPPIPREPYPSAVIDPDGWSADGRGFILCPESMKKGGRRVHCAGRYDARENRIFLADADDKVLRHELIHWLLYASYGFGDGLHETRSYWDNCAQGTKGWTWNDVLGP
ncbi:MAG: hypothetical protein HY039_07295 [Nitrospirae bacterium]|nr:hypothetical protein [Nitrospirota bacterium]